MKREIKAQRIARFFEAVRSLGFSYEEADTLRLAEKTLHRWAEMECGTENGCIERNEETGRCYWLNSHSGNKHRIRDRETGAKKRVNAIMANHPELVAYFQGDPRGCALYLVRKSDIPEGKSVDAYYTRGFAVCVD